MNSDMISARAHLSLRRFITRVQRAAREFLSHDDAATTNEWVARLLIGSLSRGSSYSMATALALLCAVLLVREFSVTTNDGDDEAASGEDGEGCADAHGVVVQPSAFLDSFHHGERCGG